MFGFCHAGSSAQGALHEPVKRELLAMEWPKAPLVGRRKGCVHVGHDARKGRVLIASEDLTKGQVEPRRPEMRSWARAVLTQRTQVDLWLRGLDLDDVPLQLPLLLWERVYSLVSTRSNLPSFCC